MDARRLRSVPALLLLVAAASAPACGWHAGLALPETADGATARTVGVELFGLERDVYERDLEPLLHRELSRAVSDLVAAPLAAPEKADLVVRGQILRYQRRGGVRSPEHELLETAVRFDARASLVDRRTGDVVREAFKAGVWSGYATGDPEREVQARERAFRNVAETLVLELFRPEGAHRAPPPEK